MRTGAADPPAAPATGDVTVFAAASLTDAFGEIARLYESQHAGSKVTFNFAGSQQLVAQILQDAPADVFASASAEQMKRVTTASLASATPVVFARNRLEIAVERGNPKKITGLRGLSRAGLVVVLAAEEVPAGKYAREALKKAGVTVTPASLETDVRSVFSKVALGEADAGIVYHSDIVAAGDKVAAVQIPTEQNVIASYPIAALAHAPHAEAAEAFVALVRSAAGRAILTKFGFGAP
jgi:molybdate transport system substrate-binding protein